MSTIDLHRRKIELLRELARRRLAPPERDRVVGTLEEAHRAAERPGGQEAVLRNAEEKAARAEADRDEKRRPYEADPLFMYLWRRRFGTSAYQASNVVRYFDRKVAHHIGFEAARVNYTMLLDLPDRLREHAERLKREQGPGASAPEDDAGLLATLAAVEHRPEIAALIADATRNPGAENTLLRSLEAIDRDLAARKSAVGMPS